MSARININNAGAGYNQGLRTGLGLSLLSGHSLYANGLKDDNPRVRPGLGRASLNLLALLARASQGSFTGVVGEDEVSFSPGSALNPDITLSLSALRFSEAPLSWIIETYVPALNNQKEPASLLISGGGTHVFGGPTTEEVNQLILPLWRKIGLDINYLEVSPGFHPNASGEVEINMLPNSSLKPLHLTTPFKPRTVGAMAVVAGLPVYLVEQALSAVKDRFAYHGFNNAELKIRNPTAGLGQALMVWADNGAYRVGFSVLGSKGTRLESMAGQAVEDMMAFLRTKAALPARIAQWCFLPMTQASGVSRILLNNSSQGLKASVEVYNKLRPGSAKLEPLEYGGVMLHVKGSPWRTY